MLNPSEFPGLDIDSLIPIINSLFKTAKIDIEILELLLVKEEVVIGFTKQVEDWESELTEVHGSRDIEIPGRYLAIARLRSNGREVPVYTRFYLPSNQPLVIEDSVDDGTTLDSESEADDPSRWMGIITNATPYGPIIVQMIMQFWRIGS